MVWTLGKYTRDSGKDSVPDSKRCASRLFSFYYYRWPKTGGVNSKGLLTLKPFCFFWIAVRGVHSASLMQKEHLERDTMGCQTCGRLLSHIWFTHLALEIFRFPRYSMGWSILKLLVEIRIGICSERSTRNSDRMAVKKKLEFCNNSFWMLMFNSCNWLLHDSFIFHKYDGFYTGVLSCQSGVLSSLGLVTCLLLLLRWLSEIRV